MNELSNTGEPGSWLFRIGPLSAEDTIEEPDRTPSLNEDFEEPLSCNNGSKLKCHSFAVCVDTRKGFCCRCKQGYYGNGYSCIKNDAPLRVSGKVSGTIGNTEIQAQLQSYVVLADGRSYTAISPLTRDIGFNSQLVYTFGGAIGWLFAKPVGTGNALNGYQVCLIYDILSFHIFFYINI